MDLTLLFTTSLLLGMRHAADADHVVAVAAIVSRTGASRRAAWTGALWGLGHSLTLFVVGGAIIALKIAFTPPLTTALELAVALMLIVLGTVNLRAARRRAEVPGVQPLLVGVVHGLAGSAAAALLMLPLVASPAAALLALLLFGAGTMLGMTAATLFVALPALAAAQHVRGFERGLRVASGLVSIALGAWLLARHGATLIAHGA